MLQVRKNVIANKFPAGFMRSKITLPSWRDPVWLFAITVGPVFWLIYSQTVQPIQFANNNTPFSALILAIFIYPVLEEIVFRGWIQAELMSKSLFQKRYFTISLANWLTSLLFSLFHLINHEPTWAALVFFPSILFGYLRDRYDAITPSITLHIFYNAGFSLLFAVQLIDSSVL